MRAAVEDFVNRKIIEFNLKIDSSIDREYAIEDFNNEQKKYDSIFDKPSPASRHLYHKYLMGEDIGGILKNEEFYLTFFYGDELFFCREKMPETKYNDKTDDATDVKVDENDNDRVMSVEPPPQYHFQLTDELYNDIYKQTFDFICQKEFVRKFKDVFTQNKLSSLPISSKVLPALGSSSDENVFNGVPLNLVKVFFNQLCDQKALTPTQLDNFILRAFQGDLSIEKQTLNTSLTKKTMIVKLFHLFYQKSIANFSWEPRRHCIEKYVELLTDNFYNCEHTVVLKNFSRNVKFHIWIDTL
jgi:hypothetical protein